MKKCITGAVPTDNISEREMENRRLAYEAASEGIVLLKNKGRVLPLKSRKVALYGAGASMTVKGGSGSGEVNERNAVSILEGMKNAGFEIASQQWLEDYQREYEQAYQAYKQEKKSAGILVLADMVNIMSNPMLQPYGRRITEEGVWASNCDTAIYVVARQAGEGADKKLDQGEYDLSEVETWNLSFLSEH